MNHRNPLLGVLLLLGVGGPAALAGYEFSPPPEQGPLPGQIVIDDADAQAVTLTGNARRGPAGGKPEEVARYGLVGKTVVSLGSWSKPNTEEAGIEFAPEVPRDGWYDLYLRWPSGSYVVGLCDSVPVTVHSADREQKLSVNGRVGNLWVLLGAYRLQAGKRKILSIRAAGTRGAISVDALRLVPTDAQALGVPELRVSVGPGDLPDDLDRLRVKAAATYAPQPAPPTDGGPDTRARAADLDAWHLWASMARDPEAGSLWGDVPLPSDRRGGDAVHRVSSRITHMARAWASASGAGFGHRMRGNPDLLRDILFALDWINRTQFHDQTVNPAGGHWFRNEISIPKDYLECLLLLYPHVPAELEKRLLAAVHHMTVDPRKFYIKAFPSTGANRVWLGEVHILKGILERNPDHLKLTRDAMLEPLKLVTRGDGFYPDGSFIQHGNVPYIGAYGKDLAIGFLGRMKLLEGSPWAYDPQVARDLGAWVIEGVSPMVWRGQGFYRNIGRAIGMERHQDASAGSGLVNAAVQLLPAATAEDRAVIESKIKAWVLEDPFGQYAAAREGRASDPVGLEVRRIVADDSIKPRPFDPRAKVYRFSDMAVYHRQRFAAAVTISSTRIVSHESIHGVNNTGFYQGEGTLFLLNADPYRTGNHFWATVDPHRLPGVTVDTRSRLDQGKKGPGNDGAVSKSPWAGGAELGEHAAVSMGVLGRGSSLSARKSWFMLGDQIVCLGSDIRASDGRAILTIVENAGLNEAGDNTLRVDGKPAVAAIGDSAALERPRWVHLAGTAPEAGADNAWFFPAPATLKAQRQTRRGSWADVSVKESDDPRTRHFVELWFDHGPDPAGAGYQYVVLPARSPEQVAAYAAKPEVEVLACLPKVHAVRHAGLGVLAATFWEPDAEPVAGLSASAPGSVIVAEGPETLTVAFADPTHLLDEPMTIRLQRRASAEVRGDERVRVVRLDPLELVVDPKGSMGRTLSVELGK